MDRWDEPEFRRDVDRLLGRAHAAARSSPGLIIEDESLPLLWSLERRIVGSSRSDYGMSLDEARALLVSACDEAVNTTIRGAVLGLIATLASEPEEWMIADAVTGLFPDGKLTVGRTDYWSYLPRWLAPERMRQGLAVSAGFVAPIAVTKVVARGGTTARVLARQRFAESAALLDLASPPPHLGSESYWLSRRGASGFAYRRSGWILNPRLVDGGRLVPPLRQLARVAKRDEDRRSDWERRLLAATRWWSRSYRSDWPADRLASCMVALECLFVPENQDNKGATIARNLTELFQLSEKSRKAQQKWLRKLYAGRSDAVHEGREYGHDLDVDRLLVLTREVIVLFAGHLVPSHRLDGRSCRTFESAMRCSRSATAGFSSHNPAAA